MWEINIGGTFSNEVVRLLSFNVVLLNIRWILEMSKVVVSSNSVRMRFQSRGIEPERTVLG